MTPPFPGRLMGIDHGLKIIGLALCDPTGTLTRPLQTLQRASKHEDFTRIDALAREHGVVALVVGLPVSPPEITGYTQADRVRLWAARLAASVDLPVYMWNERYSSQDAVDLLREAGRERPDRVDAVAAAVILQGFLDNHHRGDPWPDPVQPASE